MSVNGIVKRVVGACAMFRRYSARATEQKMADLPRFRVEPNMPPFSKTGIDFFGPWEVKRLKAVDVQNVLAQRGIEWEFNPQAGSHFGGEWERMVRTVRKVLHGLLNEQTVCQMTTFVR